jgi:glycosyltransferase involved in cell wall biosynthesis
MKVNIILSNANENSVTDTNILMFLFKKIKHKLQPKIVELKSVTCDNASINIFIGNVNPLLFTFAKTNILLTDSNLLQTSYLYMLNQLDYVFATTTTMANYLSKFIQKEQIIDIGWRSTDLKMSANENNFTKYLLFCHNSADQHVYKKIITTWNDTLSHANCSLHIVNFNFSKMQLSDITASNINIETNITQDEFERLFNTCGVHICLPENCAFSHYLNQSMLCKSIVIIPDHPDYTELTKTSDGSPADYAFHVFGRTSKHPTLFGYNFSFDTVSFTHIVNNINRIRIDTLNRLGNQSRSDALRNHARNDTLFKDQFTKIVKETLSKPKNENYLTMLPIIDDELPSVSIVTLTHNRKKFFRMAILNFNQIDYPKHKLEWIIYDTSNDDNLVEDMLPGEKDRSKYNIKYFKNNVVETIGKSRNFAMQQCQNDIVVFCDDDDYYPSTSVKKRVAPLIFDDKINVVACSAIGSFAINKFVSFIDHPALTVAPSKRYRIGTMAIRRNIIGRNETLWCDNSSINEFHTILSSKLNEMQEINWEGVIVSLIHSTNTTHRVVPQNKINERGEEINECHFGFGNKLFKFIIELDKSDKELKEREQIKEEKMKELMAQQMASQAPPDVSEPLSDVSEPLSEQLSEPLSDVSEPLSDTS